VFLAWAEMRRSKTRFGLLIAAVAMLVFLILFQQAISSALIRAFTGAIDHQSASVLVYSVDGQRVLQGSVITPALQAEVQATSGVAGLGRLGVGTFTVTARHKLVDATIVGYDRADLGAPTTVVSGRLARTDGEVVASEDDRSKGFAIGDTVTVQPGGLTLTVVGLARQAQLNVTPTLFTTYSTYVHAVTARNPDGGAPLPNVLAVAPVAGISAATLAARLDNVDANLDALTRHDAARKTPGVSQVRQSFDVIFLLYGLVVPLVTGLFFLILTFQKAGALTLLRAIGAPSSRLVRALLVQVLVVVIGGLAVGVAGYAGISQGQVGTLQLSFDAGAVEFWSAVLVILGLVSSLIAAKRVLAIDPIAATTAAGVGA
jgi:putative ABC transport system permease protein